MQDTAVASPNPEAQTATPVTSQEPVTSDAGTAQTNGSEAAGAAPSEETFYTGDPNSLPPELKQAYTNMLKDYKQKTQNVAETRKKAEAYDQVSSRSDFKEWWGGASKQQKADFKEQKAEVEKRLGEKISDEDFTKAFNSKDDFLNFFERAVREVGEKSQKKINDLEQKLSLKESQDLTSAFATEVGQDGKVIRPDFDDLEQHNLISGFLAVNQPENGTPQAQLARLHEAYGWAKQVSQKFYEKGKAEALQIIQKKAATSTEPPTQAAKGAYTGPDPKKITASEAFQIAKRGIRVPQEY